MNELFTVAEKNGNKELAMTIAIVTGTLLMLHFIHQIRLARLQIEKTKEELEDLREDK